MPRKPPPAASLSLCPNHPAAPLSLEFVSQPLVIQDRRPAGVSMHFPAYIAGVAVAERRDAPRCFPWSITNGSARANRPATMAEPAQILRDSPFAGLARV